MQVSGLTSRPCRLTPREGQASNLQTGRCEHQKLSEWFRKEKNLSLVPEFEFRIAQPQWIIPAHVFWFRFSKNMVVLVKTEPLWLDSVAIQSKGWQFSGGKRFYRLRGLKVSCDVRFKDVVSEHWETKSNATTKRTGGHTYGCRKCTQSTGRWISRYSYLSSEWTVQGSNSDRNEKYLPLDNVWGPPSHQFNGYWDSFPRLKQPGREVDLSLPSSAEIANEYSQNSTPFTSLHGADRKNFALPSSECEEY
jgi:hypothetical protein